MENPFQANNINTLREAFPNIEVRVIDDVLWSANGDLNQAFELLLSMSDNNTTTTQSPAPPLHHTLHHSTSMPFPVNNTTTTTSARTTPAKVNTSPRPMTVREELAQWRQDLREESRLRANRALNTRSSTSSLSSLSNLLHSRNKSTPQVQQRENRYQSPLRERHSTQRLSVPTPLPSNNSSSASSHNQNPIQSRATLFANQHPIRPGLPPRRTTTQSSSTGTASNNPFHSTNPFLSSSPPELNVQATRSTSRSVPLPPLPPRRSSEEQEYPSSFNPFEEDNDIPPPAYSEIQRDTVIQAQGHTG